MEKHLIVTRLFRLNLNIVAFVSKLPILFCRDSFETTFSTTPWIDLAFLTSNKTRCDIIKAVSEGFIFYFYLLNRRSTYRLVFSISFLPKMLFKKLNFFLQKYQSAQNLQVGAAPEILNILNV